MKTKLIALFLASALIYSCSKNDDNPTETNSIVGIWVATELKVDDATASDDVKNLRDGLAFLSSEDCAVVTFDFREDLTVVAENSINYIEITGLDIPCPTQKDTNTSTYTYDGTTLAIIDTMGVEVRANATVGGNLLTVDANGLDIPNLDVNGQVVFKRQ